MESVNFSNAMDLFVFFCFFVLPYEVIIQCLKLREQFVKSSNHIDQKYIHYPKQKILRTQNSNTHKSHYRLIFFFFFPWTKGHQDHYPHC
jgi:putative lipase involved disintegration of autophagic bodies